MKENIKNTFSNVSKTLANDLIIFHSLSQSLFASRVNDSILTTQSSSRYPSGIQSRIFWRSRIKGFISHSQHTIIYLQDIFGVSSLLTIQTIMR